MLTVCSELNQIWRAHTGNMACFVCASWSAEHEIFTQSLVHQSKTQLRMELELVSLLYKSSGTVTWRCKELAS